MDTAHGCRIGLAILIASAISSIAYVPLPARAGVFCWGPGGRTGYTDPQTGRYVTTGYQFPGGCYYYNDRPGGGGGGGGAPPPGGTPGNPEPNEGGKEQPTQDATIRREDCDGNPVIRSTGNKIEPELDFTSNGEMPLYLQRTYNHFWTGIGIFGKHWLSNFDYSLSATVVNGVSVLWVQYPDGRRVKFIHNAANGRYYEEKPEPIAWAVKNTDGTYTVHNEARGTERYGADGHIVELRNEQGITWDFIYSGQYLQEVRHSSGRAVKFAWTGGQLTQVTDPAGKIYKYTYAANAFGTGRGRLTSAILPGTPATTVTYHYEDSRYPGGLTGKSFNGNRYSVFKYDDQARAISTEHAGGVERYSFSYAIGSSTTMPPPPAPPPPGGYFNEEEKGWCEYQSGTGRICYEPRIAPGTPSRSRLTNGGSVEPVAAATAAGVTIPTQLTVTVTNPLGKKATYLYVNDRLESVTGLQSANCLESYKESTFDSNGYPDIVSDFEDGLTDYDYDAHGHLIRKAEASGPNQTRTTIYSWDEARNRLLKETVVGLVETSYGYDDDGRIAYAKLKNLSGNGVSGQVRTTTYTYTEHSNGLVATFTIDGPLAGDAVVSTFSAKGDLTKVSNELGHTTTYGGHNGLGMPAYIVDPNGDRTDIVYDGRGRVISQKKTVNGASQTTTYIYDGFGRLAASISPDGVKHGYQYDVAGRLTSEYVSEGGGLYAQKLYEYNAMSLPVSEEIRRVSFEPAQGTVQ